MFIYFVHVKGWVGLIFSYYNDPPESVNDFINNLFHPVIAVIIGSILFFCSCFCFCSLIFLWLCFGLLLVIILFLFNCSNNGLKLSSILVLLFFVICHVRGLYIN